MTLLHGTRCMQPKPVESNGHHVAVVAEIDRAWVPRCGRDVPPVEVSSPATLTGRDHEQQALRGREGGAERARLEGPVG